MAVRRNTIEEIRRDVPVVIYGAGVVGEAIYYACRSAGIKVDCFCDNNSKKTRGTVCGLEVIYTPDLKTAHPDADILISAADIRDAVDQLHKLGYKRWHAGSLLLRDFDVHPYRYSAPSDFVEYAVSTCLLCHDRFMTPEKLFMRSLDLIITERCSLKCRDCSNLMQYYRKPADCSTDELLRSMEALSSVVDDVNEIRVIGGEPFMNKKHHLIIKNLVENPKIRKVVIYTNGTIVPNETQMVDLRNDKVLVLITDYGPLSRKLGELTGKLEEKGIQFYSHKAGGWTDCAGIRKHGRSVVELKDLFRGCCAKNTISLSHGKIYRCPFSANAERLGAVPECKGDSVTIPHDSKEGQEIERLRKSIARFIYQKEYLRTCDYCSGRPFEAAEIPPAVQTLRPLEYRVRRRSAAKNGRLLMREDLR